MALDIGTRVYKATGDYKFVGDIRCVFYKRSGARRYVVENDDGILHIFSEYNLTPLVNEHGDRQETSARSSTSGC